MDITAILTVYKRPQNMAAQLAAIRAQTVPPKEIMVWHNSDTAIELPNMRGITYVRALPNMGVWPRFLLGMEAKCAHVCVFDDDTIPGNRWFENCSKTMSTHTGLLGTVGVIFMPNVKDTYEFGNNRSPYRRVGWPTPNSEVVEVDIVGHSWFFKKDWLRYYALEPRQGNRTCGEDYHFSVAIQKHLKLKTYVPPHPANDKSLWGSIKGVELGTDAVALYRQTGESDNKKRAHAAYRNAGWKLVSE